jgi:hypothetical protein
MMFLADAHNIGDVTPYLPTEGPWVREFLQAGVFENVLLKADHSGAFVWLRAADLAAAREAIGRLPLVANGITKVEFTEVIPFDAIPGDPAPQSTF